MQTLSIDHGLRLLTQKKFKDLHTLCISTIKDYPHSPVAYFLLGTIASEHGNHHKAIELFTRASELDNTEAYFPAYLSKELSHLRRQEQAKAAADSAAALVADDYHLLDMIAVVYSRAGFHEEAIPLFKRAIALQQGQANMHYNLGASAQFLGDFDLASSSYKAALKIDPNFYRAWASLVYLDKQSDFNNSLETLGALFEQNQQNSDAKLQLGHALAKTLEDLGDFSASFNWLQRAKEQKRKELPYDRVAAGKTFSAAKQTFTNNLATSSADMSAPIFVVGLPRTGTTLVDRIVSSHSCVTSAGELNTFAELIKYGANTESNLVLDANTLSLGSKLDLKQIGERYIDRTIDLARGSPQVLDKMPLNFFYAGLIHRALPNARIIALRRGAMDSCLSNYRQLFSTQYSFYNYTFDLDDTAWFYQQFDDLMNHWESVLPSNRFMQVHYEEIVHDQENQTRRLLDFCGLDWEDACLNFHQNEAPVSTASSVQVRQPLYSGSIGRWKKYGDLVNSLKGSLGELAN